MALPRLDREQFQGQRWATQARPWVDRLACAWLIRRFIDRWPEFIWLAAADAGPDAPPAAPPAGPPGGLGYDFDGARFSHVGALVSFEVLIAQFGLADDTPLRRCAALPVWCTALMPAVLPRQRLPGWRASGRPA